MRKFIGGVANVDIFAGDQLMATAKTLSDSSFTIGSSSEDVRGGMGNQLLAKYYHDSTFDIALTDVVFDLNYIAWQTGSNVTETSDIFTIEQVTVGAAGAITIQGTPAAVDSYGTIGWVSKMGEDDWKTITFAGKAATATNVVEGDQACVKYLSASNISKQIVVSSNFIPSEVKLVMYANEYKAGKSNSTKLNASSKIGTLQIVVPRFQFSGSMEISMSASGVANSPLEGSALAVEDSNCAATSGYYAIITETLDGDTTSDLIALAVEGGNDIQLATSGKKTLVVYGVYKTGAAVVMDNTKLTFNSGDSAKVEVDNNGVITGKATTEAAVEISVKLLTGVGGTVIASTSCEVTVA